MRKYKVRNNYFTFFDRSMEKLKMKKSNNNSEIQQLNEKTDKKRKW